MIVPRALVSQKYVPVRNCVYDATGSVVITGKYAKYACAY